MVFVRPYPHNVEHPIKTGHAISRLLKRASNTKRLADLEESDESRAFEQS